MEKPDSKETNTEQNIRKIYISDSPVAEDAVEYNYVSSDIDDDLDDHTSAAMKTPRSVQSKTKEQKVDMAPPPDLSEVDELAKEAEYQRELQDRLQKTSLEEPAYR